MEERPGIRRVRTSERATESPAPQGHLQNHFLNLAEENKEQFDIKGDDLIIDIGGNDGTQLLQYKKLALNNLLNSSFWSDVSVPEPSSLSMVSIISGSAGKVSS